MAVIYALKVITVLLVVLILLHAPVALLVLKQVYKLSQIANNALQVNTVMK